MILVKYWLVLRMRSTAFPDPEGELSSFDIVPSTFDFWLEGTIWLLWMWDAFRSVSRPAASGTAFCKARERVLSNRWRVVLHQKSWLGNRASSYY